MTVRVAAGLAVIAVAAVGCVTNPRTPEPARALAVKTWPERRAELQALNAFTLHGRVAVSTGNDGFNARLRWMQRASESEVALDGPLGVGGVRLRFDGRDLEVVTSKGDRLDRDAARAEVEQRLGFDPPMGQLRYWVLGVPAPEGEAHETLGTDGRLLALEQNGWHIDYSEYRQSGPTGELPARVTLSRHPLRVRVVVDGWG